VGENGETVETGLIGKEGMVGLAVFLGASSTPQREVNQISGTAWRTTSEALRRAAGPETALHRLLLRYAQAMLVTASQGVLCNRSHAIDLRIARWLLMLHDRVGQDRFSVTHEFLALMLGVRRASVSVALGQLQRAGLVQHHRGQMHILHRQGLEGAACECYRIITREFDRLLGELWRGPRRAEEPRQP
jgi:CRP-like cAMP-binding protein